MERIGGIVNFIRGFVRVAPPDFEIEIAGVAVGDEAPDAGWQTLALAGRPVRFLPAVRTSAARRTGRLPLKARITTNLLRKRRRIPTDGRVVQVHAPAMDLAFVGRHAPLIRVVHNDPQHLAASGVGSAWRRLGGLVEWVEDLSFRRCASIFFVSRSTYERYAAKRRFADRVQLLPNFFDESLFQPLAAAERRTLRGSLSAELGISPEVPWLLFAGRLDRQKDPALAVRTLAALRAAPAAGALLLMAGEGDLLDGTRQLAHEVGVGHRVHFLGTWPQPRLVRLMQVADAFLLTSAFESGPTVAYEALAAGLPVVGTPVGELPRIVANGSTGFVANSFSAPELAAGLEWALGQRRSAIALRCSASVRPYTTANVLQPFIAEHRRLAERG
jgi:glycosyltransferase involved in cell wall biosynthesis